MDLIEAFKNGEDTYHLKEQKEIKLTDKLFRPVPVFIKNDRDLINYTNEELYNFEKDLRAWLKEKQKDKQWKKNYMQRKFTYSQLIKAMYGREYDQKIDRPSISKTQMISHYCSRVTKHTLDPKTGKHRPNTGYCFAVDRVNKVRPFSLRLQEELLMKKGLLPTEKNIKLVKPLKRGTARYNATNKSMQKKAERARKAWEECQKK